MSGPGLRHQLPVQVPIPIPIPFNAEEIAKREFKTRGKGRFQNDVFGFQRRRPNSKPPQARQRGRRGSRPGPSGGRLVRGRSHRSGFKGRFDFRLEYDFGGRAALLSVFRQPLQNRAIVKAVQPICAGRCKHLGRSQPQGAGKSGRCGRLHRQAGVFL